MHARQVKYDQFILDKLKEYEDSQTDIDLLLSEYCWINFYEDDICKDDENKTVQKEIDTSEIEPQIYYRLQMLT